jgi:hypothetical protein
MPSIFYTLPTLSYAVARQCLGFPVQKPYVYHLSFAGGPNAGAHLSVLVCDQQLAFRPNRQGYSQFQLAQCVTLRARAYSFTYTCASLSPPVMISSQWQRQQSLNSTEKLACSLVRPHPIFLSETEALLRETARQI